MKSIKILVSLPQRLGERLKAEKAKGVTASGLIGYLWEQHFKDRKGGVVTEEAS